MKVTAVLGILLSILLISACSKDSSNSETHGTMTTPVYSSDESLSKTYEADLSTYTSKVAYWQNKGNTLVQIVEGSGIVHLDKERLS
jgi:phosphoribosyl-AMP cyclohydrolase